MRSGILGAAVVALITAAGNLAYAQAPAGQGGQRDERKPSNAQARSTPKSGAPAPEVGGNAQVQVHSTVDRTAAWVGDPITWTVEFICAPTVDVIADDMAGDKITLTGMEMVASDTTRTEKPDGTTIVRVNYLLKTFEVGLKDLHTDPFNVRYYIRRPGQKIEEVAPAGEIQVPGITLAWRSTIPETLAQIDLREDRPSDVVPALFTMARPIGLTLVLVSIAPVVIWAAAKAKNLSRPKEKKMSPRIARKEAKEALQELRNADTSTEAERREAYGRLNGVLRNYVANTSGLPAQALTAEEVAARFRRRGKNAAGGESVGDVLAECDKACFGSTSVLPPPDQFRDSIDLIERTL